MSGLIKICGISREDHAEAVAASGADFIGFMFVPESRRRAEPWKARVCAEHAKAVNPHIRAVGVFLGASIQTIGEVREEAGLDLVQIHDLPGAEWLSELAMPAWITARAEPGIQIETIDERFRNGSASGYVEALLFDAYHPTQAGGTGLTADWGAARQLAARHPLILAGGLSPKNVDEAINTVRPRGVDVSSGVERDGAKDPALIAEFVQRARAAFEAYSISRGTSSQV